MKGIIDIACVVVIETPVTISVSEYSNSADGILQERVTITKTPTNKITDVFFKSFASSWERPTGDYLIEYIIHPQYPTESHKDFGTL